jgi:rhodanese-related sulfurtransferase
MVESKNRWLRAAWQLSVLVLLSTAAALAVNGLRTERLPLVGDFSAAALITTATGERMDISLEEAEALFRTRKAVFVDARAAEEYARGRIRGARSLPWQEADLKFIGATADLDWSTPLITYCDGETCESSHDLALFLRDIGFLDARVLVNGWTLWQQAGLPTESGG